MIRSEQQFNGFIPIVGWIGVTRPVIISYPNAGCSQGILPRVAAGSIDGQSLMINSDATGIDAAELACRLEGIIPGTQLAWHGLPARTDGINVPWPRASDCGADSCR